jgi:predicted RNA-binding protein
LGIYIVLVEMLSSLLGWGTHPPPNNNNHDNDDFPNKYTGRSYNNMLRSSRNKAHDLRVSKQRHVFGVDPGTITKDIIDLRKYQEDTVQLKPRKNWRSGAPHNIEPYEELAILRSILVDIKKNKFKIDPRTKLPILSERADENERRSTFQRIRNSNAFRKLMGIVGAAMVALPFSAFNVSGISQSAFLGYSVCAYIYVYVEGELQKREIVEILKTDDLIKLIDTILTEQQVTQGKNPLFLTPEELEKRNFFTPEELSARAREPPSSEELKWREKEAAKRRADATISKERMREALGLVEGGYTRKRKAKKSKSTRRR